MIINAFTDGASRGNPGHAGIGLVLRDPAGEVIESSSRYIGLATNNVAEYTALLDCLKTVAALGVRKPPLRCSRLVVHSDSELMVRQLNGEYKVRDRVLRDLHDRVRETLRNAPYEFSIRHIPREENSAADELANIAIDDRRS